MTDSAIAAQADAGVKVPTIHRRAAAIHFRHASGQVDSPTRSMLLTVAQKGLRASSASRPRARPRPRRCA